MKKILGILICLLLIATVVPAVTSVKNSSINTISPTTQQTSMAVNWTEMQKLLASDGASNDRFGGSVSLYGNTALIGAYGDDAGRGAAYVFTRSGTTWTQQAKLLASDGTTQDYFGCSVSLDGDTAVIVALGDDSFLGSAYVFTRTGTSWTQQAKLLASDGAEGDLFGCSVLDGDTAVIGAVGDDSFRGSAYVFTKSGTNLVFSISGGLGVKLKITNNGTSNANDVPWQIHVQGGILGRINKTVNGTVDVPLGESMTIVETGLFFGLGSITITAKVADEEQTAKGTQLIIFSMVKT